MMMLDKNGEARCANTLELLGHWFKVDNSHYFVPLNKKKYGKEKI